MPVRTMLTPAAATSARPFPPPGLARSAGGAFESAIGNSLRPPVTRAPVAASIVTFATERAYRRPEIRCGDGTRLDNAPPAAADRGGRVDRRVVLPPRAASVDPALDPLFRLRRARAELPHRRRARAARSHDARPDPGDVRHRAVRRRRVARAEARPDRGAGRLDSRGRQERGGSRGADRGEPRAAAAGGAGPQSLPAATAAEVPRRQRLLARLEGVAVVGALAFVLFVLVPDRGWDGLDKADQEKTEALLSSEAGRIAGHTAVVHCDARGEAVGVVQHADGIAEVGGRNAYLTPDICYRLYRLSTRATRARSARPRGRSPFSRTRRGTSTARRTRESPTATPSRAALRSAGGWVCRKARRLG